MYSVLADIVVVLHLLFILFAVLGGFLVLYCRCWIWFHLPAALYALAIAIFGWICPLTPLENWLRAKSGGAIYEASFIEEYLMPLIYTPELTVQKKIAMAAGLILINGVLYALVIRQYRTSVL